MTNSKKARVFTFALSEDKNDIPTICEKARTCSQYAFIRHDHDNLDNIHWHFVIKFDNPRTFQSVANFFDIPTNQVQRVFDFSGILAYLTHEKNPEKYHYSKTDIETNIVFREKVRDALEFFHDFDTLDFNDFVQKYNDEIMSMQLQNRIRVLDRLRLSRDAGTRH